MDLGLLALALGAGMVAAVNPCGFALLPAYLSLVVLDGSRPDRRAAVGRALALTGALTLGFLAVFGLFGLVVAPVASGLQRHLPWVTVVLGLLLVLLGAWLLSGRSLPAVGWSPPARLSGGNGGVVPPGRKRAPGLTRRLGSMVGFGAAYALASLTCTIGPFLAIVVASFRAGSPAAGATLFGAYAMGMGLAVGAAAVAVALARASLIDRLRRAGGRLPRVAGLLMIVVGGYVAWYGGWELRVLDGGPAADPVVQAAARMQGWLAGAVTALGPLGLVLVLAALVAFASVLGRRRRSDVRKAQRG